MSSTNRATKYEQLYKILKKHFKPTPEVGERTVLEHLLYACCLEDARAEQADEAFAKLQQTYFDWNEVRVTTATELSEALSSLPNAVQAGHRIKRCLQSMFEARYQYDIDDLKKANLGKAIAEIEAWKGITPFVLNYVSQNSLGGHAIPADNSTFEALQQCEIITQSEADKKTVPGVERAIPKNKGNEFASLLHQFAVEFALNQKAPAVVAVFKELGVTPKQKAAPKPSDSKKAAEKAAAEKTAAAKATAAAEEAAGTKSKPAATTSAKAAKPAADAKESDKSTVDAKAAKKSEPAKDVKPAEAKKSEAKRPEVKKTDAKTESKAEAKTEPKTEVKADTKKPAAKPAEPKEADAKAAAAKKPAAKPAPAKPKTTTKNAASKPKPAAGKSTPPKTVAPAKTTKKKPR